ncbi:hypothetical protein ILP92_14110 [Maribius pontilimi]|uniref:Uncharacterized protein n=1 Tax=Palleronia pontilimi TaxID=1964209 RepID=A0A934IB63_9RHOB|nr:hypothetical protein [Palleronia pontilimi]MBJ3763883.1 hypothetical protein [Palleronia pontilimi]
MLRSAVPAAFAVLLSAAIAQAAPRNSDTPADTLHPNIHSKVGRGDGTNANPNGKRNGGQIHGIANTPGQSGADPAQGRPGFADQLQTVHGGIGAKNKNAR